MSWIIFALVCTLGWGTADLFYKIGSDEEDPCSHLKQAVWVGLVMGAASFALLLLSAEKLTLGELFRDAIRYAPASLSYIISMVIGYAGLRYLELSIVSPVQNASGALSMLMMILWFMATGKIGSIGDSFSPLDITGTVLIVAGVIALSVTEKRINASSGPSDKKYRLGALALLFPLAYCVFDTIGTAADGIILDGDTGLGLSEINVLLLYGFTFFLAGIVCFFVLRVKEKKWYRLFDFRKGEGTRALAALCEEFGQIFYVFAMAKEPVLAAPFVASYCIISMIFSGIFLREKLKTSQYLCILPVILGIVVLGISEGLAAG